MVTIPRIQRLQSNSNQVTSQRIQGRAPNTTGLITGRVQGISRVTSQVADQMQRAENSKIKQLSDEGTNSLKQWEDLELDKLKQIKDDSTKQYAAFDEARDKKYSEFLGKYSDTPERVQRHLKANLDTFKARGYGRIESQRQVQKRTYRNNLFHTVLKNRQDFLSENALDPVNFNSGISDIKKDIALYGLENGTVEQVEDEKQGNFSYVDEDGKKVHVKMSPIAQRQFVETTSKGVFKSIDALISSGETKKAKAMKEVYGDYLIPSQKTKLNNKLKNTDQRSEASNFYNGVQYLEDKDQLSKINKIKDVDLRNQVLKVRDTAITFRNREEKRKQDSNYEVLAKHVLSKSWNGLSELENDKVYGQTFENLSAKQQQAIIKTVKPKDNKTKSNPEFQVKANQLRVGNEVDGKKLTDMKSEDLMQYTAHLSLGEASKLNNAWVKANSSTGAERLASYKRADKFLKDEMIRNGLIERNPDFPSALRTDDDVNNYNEGVKFLTLELENREDVLSEKEKIEFVTKFVKQKLINDGDLSFKALREGATNKIILSSDNPTGSGRKEVKLTRQQKRQYSKIYYKTTGKFKTDDIEAYNIWLNEQVGKNAK